RDEVADVRRGVVGEQVHDDRPTSRLDDRLLAAHLLERQGGREVFAVGRLRGRRRLHEGREQENQGFHGGPILRRAGPGRTPIQGADPAVRGSRRPVRVRPDCAGSLEVVKWGTSVALPAEVTRIPRCWCRATGWTPTRTLRPTA